MKMSDLNIYMHNFYEFYIQFYVALVVNISLHVYWLQISKRRKCSECCCSRARSLLLLIEKNRHIGQVGGTFKNLAPSVDIFMS